jgi:hypothetical protein
MKSVITGVLCNIHMYFLETGKANKYLNESYIRVRVGKHLKDMFLAENVLKQGDTLSPFLFKFA